VRFGGKCWCTVYIPSVSRQTWHPLITFCPSGYTLQQNFVSIVEAKKVSLGEARKQCFLSMRDMQENNGGGTIYGFITTGDSWRMVSYDGTFKITEKMELLFDTMDEDKQRWMEDYSVLVDCLNVALSNGDI